MEEPFDIAVIGAGAAGLFASIWAGREASSRGTRARIIALDGAKKLGAKILVAGGGRCNVTHHAVDESAYAGASRKSIRKVLLRFGVDQTVDFFREQGVELKREDTGKLFPVADDGRVVLDAILRAASNAGVELRHPWRVASITREGELFAIRRELAEAADRQTNPAPEPRTAPGDEGVLLARRIILATGGKALPKTGSDGAGYAIARELGHTLTDHVFPALVPLTTPKDWFLTALSGIALPMRVEVIASTGKRLVDFTNSTLLTHFGLSGPSILDASRYLAAARLEDPGASLRLCFTPNITAEALDARILALHRLLPTRLLMDLGLPERLARALCEHARVDPGAPLHSLDRARRRALVDAVTALAVPITGDRGFTYAEVTAGGVPLTQIRLETMESRACPALHLCGEICDVDGRIGGFNFQWAWASGYVAGISAARASKHDSEPPTSSRGP